MRKYRFNQSASFVLSTLVIMLAVGAVMIVFLRGLFYQNLKEELQEKGILLSRYIAERNADAILAEDSLELLNIREVLKRLVAETPTLSYVFIQSTDGRILAHTFGNSFPSDLRKVNPVPPGAFWSQRRLDIGQEIIQDIATQVYGPLTAEIHVGLSEAHIASGLADITRMLLLILSGAFLTSTLFIALVSGYISRPVRILTRAAEELRSGRLDVRVDVRRSGEMGVLGRTFNSMAESLERSSKDLQALNREFEDEIGERQRNEEALRESEEKTRAFWENTHTGIYVVDANTHRIRDINQTALRIIGLPRGQVVGRECHRFVCPAEKNACPATDLGQEIENSERVLLTADGRSLPIMKSVKLIHLDGQSHLIESFVDISDLKRGQETIRAALLEKSTLLKEVHHRVKNNLQALSALLNLQAYYSGEGRTQGILADCQNRLQTMALIHQDLYESNDVANVNFAGYIDRLSHYIMETHGAHPAGIDLKMSLQEAILPVDTAIPVGLIVNELLTNAVKHAFPDGRRGQVSVTFQDFGEGLYMIKVEDDGVGLPQGFDINTTHSMGMQLITILTEQLGGQVKVGGGPGARFGILFGEYREASTLVV
ncbi:MAG: histidine kinase dimerization/phosphoacceptor domain -containing protein [bacterium]|nr:histidine kinase dimerization/phosphoacceptor domain -containing protein [bacterium]